MFSIQFQKLRNKQKVKKDIILDLICLNISCNCLNDSHI